MNNNDKLRELFEQKKCDLDAKINTIPESDPNDFFNRVYYCRQYGTTIECIQFNTLKEAYMCKRKLKDKVGFNKEIIETIMPVCKYVPPFMDNYVLSYKLKNMTNVKIL